MKTKWFRIPLYVLTGLLVAMMLLISYVKLALPNVGPPPDIQVEATPDQLLRGEYLANHVMVCMECHSQRDWSLFAAPSLPGTRGIGGEIHDQRLGFPGKYVSPNITPAGLSDWSDGEIFRAITSGVNKDGKPLFPIMPHPNFGQLDKEDIKSVIAYLRTLAPVEYTAERSHSDFPMNLIIHTIPKKADLKPMPSRDDLIAYGKYLVTAGTCYDCHTNFVKGKAVGPDFAGGMEFPLADGSIVRSANLTPDATGLGAWTSDQFVRRFKQYRDSSYVAPRVGPGDFQTVMPWNTYSGMAEDDLRAIFAYLNSLEAIEHVFDRFTSSADQM
jgi:mono/diheme cytochrome c family protein